jgi:hypothetical protein
MELLMSRRDDRELQESIKAISAIVCVGLLALIVLAAVSSPLFHVEQDTTLLLGLAAALIGGLLPLVGIQIQRSRRNGRADEEDEDDGPGTA